MEVYCRYRKTLYRDEQSGFTVFAIHSNDERLKLTDYGTAVVKGMIQPCFPETPLFLSCKEEKDPQGRTCYQMEKYEFSSDRENTVKFLSTSLFKGIGEKRAVQVYDLSGGDIFSFCLRDDAAESLKGIGIKDSEIRQAVSMIRTLLGLKDTLSFIVKFGGTYETADALYRRYKEEAVKKIEEDPFRLLDVGVSFTLCEQLAVKKGIYKLDERRLLGLIKTAMKQVIRNGNTKSTFHDFCRICRRIETCTESGRITSPFFLASTLIEKGYVIKKEEEEYYVYDPFWYQKEKNISDNINRLNFVKGTWAAVDNKLISEIEEECGIRYSKEQKEAFHLLETPGIKILTGGPGTGKTTVINGLILASRKRYPDVSIRLCAPTGCAAKKMSQATGEPAQTIHRMLGVKPYGKEMIQERNQFNQLDADILIVDEVSMIDTLLFWMLLQAVKNGAIVLLSGDEDQLKSVGPGNILHDLLDTKDIDRCRLLAVFRQKRDSVHYENSKRILDGSPDLLTGADCRIIRCHKETEMLDLAEKFMEKYYKRESPDQCKLFSTVKKNRYLLSTRKINNDMHSIYAEGKESLQYGEKAFSVGDPVIFCENNYKTGTFNGDIGTVVKIEDSVYGKTLSVQTDIGIITLSGSSLKEIELAYAVTIHKAQGSECDTAIILLPKEPGIMLERSLIYVAATRAKKQVIWITQDNALESGIKTSRKNERRTGLKDRLQEQQ